MLAADPELALEATLELDAATLEVALEATLEFEEACELEAALELAPAELLDEALALVLFDPDALPAPLLDEPDPLELPLLDPLAFLPPAFS